MLAESSNYILGLGNPVPYKNTWHNIGKDFLLYLVKKFKLKNYKKTKFFTLYLFLKNSILIIPTDLYMNEIGYKICSHLNISKKRLITIVDEIDLPFGTYKITSKFNKKHKGVFSITNSCKYTTKKLWIRIGIATKISQTLPRKIYVLEKIPIKKLDILYTQLFPNLAEKLKDLISNPGLIERGY